VRWSIKQLLIPGLILYVVLLAVLHVVIDSIHIVVTAAGCALFVAAIAALAQAWVKTKRYMDERNEKEKELVGRQDELEHQLNGGLMNLATQVMNDELRQAGFEADLGPRVAFLEEHYKDCLEREAEWQKERVQVREDRKLLRDLMIERLRGSGK